MTGLITEEVDQYHASEGFSKTFLWAMDNETPFIARYGKRKESHGFDIGSAAHIAILEPHDLESRIMRGPDDRRGNKWKEAQDFATYSNKLLLTAGDHDMALLIRDLADTVPELAMMRELDDEGRGPVVETSCYHTDPETGLTVKCRPDLYSPKHKLIVDIKNMASASKDAWEKATGSYGYHMQEAVYSDVWASASGYEVEGFWFAVFEKSEPPQVKLYELDPDAVAEGHARYRRALARTAECVKANEWPSYEGGIHRSGLRRYDYRINHAPEE